MFDLDLDPRPSKTSQFICRLNYVIGQVSKKIWGGTDLPKLVAVRRDLNARIKSLATA